MNTVASESLLWIKQELDNTLVRARQALEVHVENQDDPAPLAECLENLHQVQGTLRMVEVYGAAMLAEEMEAVVKALLGHGVRERNDAYEVLMRAMLQLPDYLERVVAGQRDVPLALLSLLNDLRSVRGEPLLSESSLFVQNLSERGAASVGARAPVVPSGDIVATAKQVRPKFQSALLGWYKGDNATAHLKALAKVAEQLEQASVTPVSFQLWWVVGGALEAILDGGLDASVSLKQMLGQVDRQLKRLIDEGEAALAAEPPNELVNNLLYYVGKASSTGERVTGLKESFRLGELLPDEEQVAQAKQNLQGPNLNLMRTVSVAIKEDLARVKDTLDIFVRTKSTEVGELGDLPDLLKKVGDTLGMLGLGALRESMEAQRGALVQVADGRQKLDDRLLMDVASSIIRVESALDAQISDLVSGDATRPAAEELDGLRVQEADFRLVSNAVIRESIINLARVKDAIAEYIRNPVDHKVLEPIPALVHQIQAGLRLLDFVRPAELLKSISRYIRKRIFVLQGIPPQNELDRMADAIVSVEFYLETIQQGRGNPLSMLDNAESCVKALGYPVGQALPDDDDIPAPLVNTVLGLATGLGTGSELGTTTTIAVTFPAAPPAEEPTLLAETPTLTGETPAPAVPAQPAPAALPAAKPAVVARPEEIDPEIIEIFLEESQEEIASLREHFPRWMQHPELKDELTTVRRSFHTLKGSGRMVGAELIGEFAWSFENMINRVIDQTVVAGPEMFTLIQRGIDALPELIEQLEAGTPPQVDFQGLMDQAQAMARGEYAPTHPDLPRVEVEAEIPLSALGGAALAESGVYPPPMITRGPVVPGLGHEGTLLGDHTDTLFVESVEMPQVEEPEPESGAMDPVLHDIFSREVEGHLAVIEGYLAEAAAGPTVPTDELVRALHTLHGSASMAGAPLVVQISDPLERHARAFHDAAVPLGPESLAALTDAVSALRDIVASLVHGLPDARAHGPLVRRAVLLALEIPPAPSTATDLAAPVDQVAAPAEVPQRFITLAELGDFDAELAGVFMEEANELLEATDAALHAWQREQQNPAHVAELQRHLHTLKGGARMAGITPMGDLSHEMESLLTEVVDGRLPVSAGMFALAQRSFDRLHRMLEQVYSSKPIVDAQDLVMEIKRFAHGVQEELQREEAEEYPIAMPVVAAAPAPVPVASPAPVSAPAAAALARPEPEPEERVFDAGEGDRRRGSRIEAEMVRVRADLIESLLNAAGEVSIYRARLDQQVSVINSNLGELEQTVVRLREQLRKLEIETEAQILSQYVQEGGEYREGFDPLELDQYSTLQQLSRALAESVNDLNNIQGLLSNQAREAETLLLQQSRVNTALQDGLMRTRMLPLTRHAQRLRRVLRQTADEVGKQVELKFVGAEGEMDRQVLERIVAPLEHMLRNSVIHGIELPERRRAASKPAGGTVTIRLHREGAEVVMEVFDDGAGLDVTAIRRKAEQQGMVKAGLELPDDDVMQFILESGFSTAREVTQAAGRGVGMDVVASEVKQLGGSLRIQSVAGKGAHFTIRLPFTLAISQALIVNVAEEIYAIPLPSIEGIVRVRRKDLLRLLEDKDSKFDYGGIGYTIYQLGVLLGVGAPTYPEELDTIPVILVRAGEHAGALVTEGMQGSREIVVKSVGPQVASVKGIAGATILGDGSIVLILDAGGLVRVAAQQSALGKLEAVQRVERKDEEREKIFAMVVDDSITVRRVTQRLLERFGMRVITAKDGVDALALLQENLPDVMLLDIEMPRMDGYELASKMRADERFKDIPIVMITSRTGEKHRNRAMEIGVNRYLGKPYQEAELIETIQTLVGRFNPERTRWD